MKKVFLLLIDALRHDVLADPSARAAMLPNLARLADRGFVVPVTANGQSTQMVMPALFSLTYPLDYGGYNNGIRDRPTSYIELLREAGYETHLMSPGNQLGIAQGYDRGFTTVRTTSDYRTLLQQRLERTLNYELGLWKNGERTDPEILAFIQKEFGLLLRSLIESIEKHDKSLWPAPLRRINQRVTEGCVRELQLLRDDPRAVLDKLTRISAGVYWRTLGVRDVGPFRVFVGRAIASLNWRTRNWIAMRAWFPFLPLGHRQTITGDIIPAVCRFIEESRDRPWYIHMHVMDAHDCRAINRPLHVVGRLRYLPRWLWARLRGLTKRRFLYDSAVMYVDRHVGDLVGALDRSGQIDETIFLVFGDHGNQYAESPRPKETLGLRFHYEHLEVPLLAAGMDREPARQGLLDTMGITASLLSAVGVKAHPSHKGISAFVPGRQAIISESCGHGNADLDRRDLFFAVTTERHRMMAILSGNRLQPIKLFDRGSDPRELRNLVDRPDMRPVLEEMLGHLRRERADLLAYRKVAA